MFNGGLDGTGTHTGSSFDFDTVLSSSPISLDGVEVEDSGQARSAFRQFFQSGRRLKRITLKVLQMFKCRSQ